LAIKGLAVDLVIWNEIMAATAVAAKPVLGLISGGQWQNSPIIPEEYL